MSTVAVNTRPRQSKLVTFGSSRPAEGPGTYSPSAAPQAPAPKYNTSTPRGYAAPIAHPQYAQPTAHPQYAAPPTAHPQYAQRSNTMAVVPTVSNAVVSGMGQGSRPKGKNVAMPAPMRSQTAPVPTVAGRGKGSAVMVPNNAGSPLQQKSHEMTTGVLSNLTKSQGGGVSLPTAFGLGAVAATALLAPVILPAAGGAGVAAVCAGVASAARSLAMDVDKTNGGGIGGVGWGTIINTGLNMLTNAVGKKEEPVEEPEVDADGRFEEIPQYPGHQQQQQQQRRGQMQAGDRRGQPGPGAVVRRGR